MMMMMTNLMMNMMLLWSLHSRSILARLIAAMIVLTTTRAFCPLPSTLTCATTSVKMMSQICLDAAKASSQKEQQSPPPPADLNAQPPGRVSNVTQWLEWSDRSLQRLSSAANDGGDGKGGMYDRINAILAAEKAEEASASSSSSSSSFSKSITTAEQLHKSLRFAVLSHGNQTDPIYNYVNAAGFQVFQWPEDQYYKLPSRYSAPTTSAGDNNNAENRNSGDDNDSNNNNDQNNHRATRASLIQNTIQQGVQYIAEAVRVRYPASRVVLREAILWNVYDDDGYRVGQTVLFDEHLVSYL